MLNLIYINIALISLFTSSITETPPAGWFTERSHMSIDVKADASNDRQLSIIRTKTADPDKPRIAFACSEGLGLTASLNTDPEARKKVQQSSAKRVLLRSKIKKEKITFDSNDSHFVAFVYTKKNKTYQPTDFKITAKIYNSVAKQHPFTIGKTVFTPPPVDDDFRIFAATCKEMREQKNK
jgi:hypothetical protein